MHKARFNSRMGIGWVDLESQEDYYSYFLCCSLREELSSVPRNNAESKFEPRLSGLSIRRTIAGAVSAGRSPLQVPSDDGQLITTDIGYWILGVGYPMDRDT